MHASDIARVCHEANRAIQITLEEEPNPHWDDAPDWQRESAVNGVENAQRGATPEESHKNWLSYKEAEGWTYGETKDADAKTRPCMVPYEQLPEDQKLKDHVFTAIVSAL